MIRTFTFGNKKQYVLSINLSEYVLNREHNTYWCEWYHGCLTEDVKLYNKSKVGESRFALPDRAVRYFSKSNDRINYEINKGDSLQIISGSFKISEKARIFNLSKKIENAFIGQILKYETEEAYKYSSDFSQEILKEGFDGILYESRSFIDNPMGIGPHNDPVLVLFEPQEIDRKLFCSYHSGNDACLTGDS